MEPQTPLVLGEYPTPIGQVPLADAILWVKRDDRSSPLYGGNKVRKLERLFGAALAEGRQRIVTLGAAGSHQLVATAVFGRREGFSVDAVLVAQPRSDHARANLRAAVAHGLRPTVAGSWALVPPLVARLVGTHRDAYLVPLGGSNAIGSMGFVDAVRELAAQVGSGALHEPDEIVVAMGSGGTAAGLAVGLELLEMKTRVRGVVISSPARLLGALARQVARSTARAAGLSKAQAVRALDRIEVDRRWLGRGYGYATEQGIAATEVARRHGLGLDPTYTAKAFACALDVAESAPDRAILYWHTLSSAPMEPLLEGAPALPPSLEALFT